MGLLFTASTIKRLIYLLLISGIVFFALSNHYTQINWFIWALLALSFVSIEAIEWRQQVLVCAAGLAIIIAVVISGSISSQIYLLASYLFILTAVCMFGSQLYPQSGLALFTVNLFALVASQFMPTWIENVDRMVAMSAGLLLAILVQLIFFWPFRRSESRLYLVTIVQELRKLSEEIFENCLVSEYGDSVYLFERRLHLQKNKTMRAFDKLRQWMLLKSWHANEKEALQALTTRLHHLYALLLDCAQLRFRITDYTTLDICKQEMTEVAHELDILFAVCMKPHRKIPSDELKLALLEQKIKRLEENYQHVLQVAAPEPLIFLLFIAGLQAIHLEMTELINELRNACHIKLI